MYWNCWSVTHRLSRRQGLIETWDVLKFVFACRSGLQIPINRNMRCIEIPLRRATVEHPLRLIETWDVLKWHSASFIPHFIRGLIETWDVLKFTHEDIPLSQRKRLIETWDVLKFEYFVPEEGTKTINRNMRCIEMVN